MCPSHQDNHQLAQTEAGDHSALASGGLESARQCHKRELESSLVPRSELIGRSLGPYEILEQLGAGGMGEVYRAKDSRVDRAVALKVLPEEFFEDSERRGRFEREAKLLASLNHPGIAVLYSFEEIPGSSPSSSRHLLAMELVEGEGLATLIASGPLPLEEFLSFARQIAEAVAAAHEKGVFHRDLKPANIKVSPGGRIKLLDFGLAKKSEGATVGSEDVTSTGALTQQGVVMGTVPYMSPEQVSGREVDHRTDIFSLGVILYEMATGRRPFEGHSTAELASAILRDTPRPVTELRADLPPHLGRILGRCLEKDPRDRYQTSRDLYNELAQVRAEISSSVLASRESAAGAEARSSTGATRADRGLAASERRRGECAASAPAAWKRPAWAAAADPPRIAGVSRGHAFRRPAPGLARARARERAAGHPIDCRASPRQLLGRSQPGLFRRRDDRRVDGRSRDHQPASSDLARLGDAIQGQESAADPRDRQDAQRRRDRGRFGAPSRRQGADHGPIDRRAGGPASVGQELRAQLARRAGASG